MVVQNFDRICHHGSNLFCQLQVLIESLLIVHCLSFVIIAQHEVVVFHEFGKLFCEVLCVEGTCETNAASCNFVFIGRPYSSSGCAYLCTALLKFSRLI